MSPEPSLRFGYSLKTKLILGLPTALCSWLLISAISSKPDLAAPLTGSAIALLFGPQIYAWRKKVVFHAAGLTRYGFLGWKTFRREDFQAYEFVSDGPGNPPGLLLRFKTGIVFLDASQSNIDSPAVVSFLKQHWNIPPASSARPAPLGKVDLNQVFYYEPIHASLALISASVLTAAAVWLPVLWSGLIFAGFCARSAWRCFSRLESNEQGLTWAHQFSGSVSIAWNEVESVRYWSSLAQGGMEIRGAGKVIRVYRWIGNYPVLNRLLHDKLKPSAFAPELALPLKVELNNRRRLGVCVPYLLVLGGALPVLFGGNFMLFVTMLAIPTLLVPVLLYSQNRTIEIDSNGVRDTMRFLWMHKSTQYSRAELEDARLGRQLHVGGLWLKFGNQKLEIVNADASLPPEQLLACLRKEWAWETGRVKDDWTPQLPSAAA